MQLLSGVVHEGVTVMTHRLQGTFLRSKNHIADTYCLLQTDIFTANNLQ